MCAYLFEAALLCLRLNTCPSEAVNFELALESCASKSNAQLALKHFITRVCIGARVGLCYLGPHVFAFALYPYHQALWHG